MTLIYAFALAACMARVVAMAQPQDAKTLPQLETELRRALDQDDWERAIEVGLRLANLKPKDANVAYDLACLYAKQDNKDQAVAWLKAAGERGFYYLSTLLRDADLDALRPHPSFDEAVALVRQNNEAELAKFKARHPRAKMGRHVPPGLDPAKPAPLIVALHGRGGNAQSMVNLWRAMADEFGAVLIAPEAVAPLAEGFDWGVVEQGEYLVLRAIEQAKKEHPVDDKRIVLTGFSQGGAMCYTVALRHSEMFAGVIPVAGGYDHRVTPIPDPAPPTSMPKRDDMPDATSVVGLPRFYIMIGGRDDELPTNRQAASRLEALGAPHRLKVFDGLGHGLPPNKDAELREALTFVLPK